MLTIAFSLLAGYVTSSFEFGVVLGLGCWWFSVTFFSAPTPEDRWSPLRLFAPILATYTFGSIVLNNDETLSIQLLATVLALAGFMIGCKAASVKRPGVIEPGRYSMSSKTSNSCRFDESQSAGVVAVPLVGTRMVVLTLSTLIGVALIAILAVRGNGLPIANADSNSARLSFFPNGIWSTAVVLSLQFSLVVGSVGAISESQSQVTRRVSAFMSIVALVALSTLANRGMLVAPILAVAIYAFWRRPIRPSTVVIVGIVALSALSYMGYRRNIGAFGQSYLSDLADQGYRGFGVYFAPLLSYLQGTSETFARTIYVVQHVTGFQYGEQFFGPILGNISADMFLKNALLLDFEGFGLAIGYVNAFYLDWGIPGCFFGSLGFGFFMTRIHRLCVITENPRWIVTYTYLLARLILSVYGHPFAYLYYLIMPFCLYFAFYEIRSRNLLSSRSKVD